jgi:SAM-dependent methyltransferase
LAAPDFLRSWLRRQEFHPTILGAAVNPAYIARSRLRRHIMRHSGTMTGRMLDFGCGSKPYRELFAVSQYVGVDVTESGHPPERSAADVLYDGHTLPFPEAEFDCAFSSEVLEHVFNPDEILAELHRVIRPYGQLIITTPFVWGEHEQPFDYGRYTSFGMKHLLEKNGFEVVDMQRTTNSYETIAQLTATHIYQALPQNGIVRHAAKFLVAWPVTIAGLLLGRLLPNDETLYLNLVVLARRR